jgi:amino acid adenylation domain-containing protein
MTGRTAPLSFGQELFWLLDSATPGLVAYNVPRAFRIRGPLDDAALERAFNALIERHEVLRSVYSLAGDHPVQTVVPDARVPFDRVDLSALGAGAREVELSRQLAERASQHFDLSRDVLLRAALFTLGADDHALFFLTHHIVSDGWTKSVTFRELSELYAADAEGRAPALAPLPIQFADYARRERDQLEGEELEARLAYWREQLRGPLPVLDLHTDRPRPATHTFDGDFKEIVLPASLVDGMRRLGQERGATLYMVLLAAYQTLLHRYSGQDDIITGSPTAGRDEDDTQDLIGYFAGALVLRNSFAGDPGFGELLERVSNTCLDAYEHQDLPFEKLVLELQKGQKLTHAPLFQCVLTMEDTIPAELTLGAASLEPINLLVPATKFDLTLLFSEHADGLKLRLAYRTALFDGDRAAQMLGHLRTLLDAAIADPSRAVSALPLLTEDETRKLLVDWNGEVKDEGAPTTIVAMAERHASLAPERTAVVGDDETLTWAELDARANRIAHWLIAHGAEREARVGLCLDRSAAMIAAMLGILKSGAAYVPLLPDLPAARLADQIRESGAKIVVTTSAHQATLPSGVRALLLDEDAAVLSALSSSSPSTSATPESLAYVLFTSGSTGVPKGVAVTHANLVHYVRAIAERVELDLSGAAAPWHFATVSTLGADLGHTAVFPALCSGGALHVISTSVATDAARFAQYVSAQPLDLLKITPNHLRALLAGSSASAILPGKWIVLGGEACPWDLAYELLRANRCRVLNHYGPTETTVGVCTYEVRESDVQPASATVPIGRPLANTTAYVRDAHGELTPVGVAGELYIGGAGVARGYLGRDDLTRDRFVMRDGERLYRTGDRVRWLAKGALEFLGRADEQVKVRGFRVEPGEIIQSLRAHPGVEACAVLLRGDSPADSQLVAYVVAKQSGYAVSHGDRPTTETLGAWCAAQLPEYMVPGAFVFLEQLPLTANGKLDREALPAHGAEAKDAYVAPESPTEVALAQIWSEILKRDRIGTRDSFIALGGQSLLAIRVLGKISKQFGVRLPLRSLFEAPTIAELSSLLEAARREKEESAMLAALAAVEGLSDADASGQLASDAPEGAR